MKKNTHSASKEPQHLTHNKPPVRVPVTRPEPDPSDLALTQGEDPCPDDNELFRPRLKWRPE